MTNPTTVASHLSPYINGHQALLTLLSDGTGMVTTTAPDGHGDLWEVFPTHTDAVCHFSDVVAEIGEG